MKSIVHSLCNMIDNNEPFTLATVVESSGSTPRSSGAKMAIRKDGSIVGTVGGGLLEAVACREGKAMLNEEDGFATLTYVDMTQELAANSDMICGGGLSLLLQVVQPEGECAAVYKQLIQHLQAGRPSVLHSVFQIQGKNLQAIGHEIVTHETAPQSKLIFARASSVLSLEEPFIPPAPLYLFGAGHVSLFTAQTGAMAGFRTVVVDDRADYANQDRFPCADQIVVLDTFDNCCEKLGIGEDAFIVIVTRGHLHDRTVLAQALKTKARYVGMIGSRQKRDKIYDALHNEGYTHADIDRCHCPIGLDLGGQTPEEIAVSIVAELIQVRSGKSS